uniref:Putative reverse transcriptase domain-containing protein n=1 Tax=Tanacetum cinerariifolium TaxID=118510 RepID=A0A6L2K8H4_TANCI|nr:putative reverse transcriptase domain-containing protein [Tanacetum cinerariifolium]
MILAAQSRTSKAENASAEMLRGLDQQVEKKEDGGLYFMDQIWFPLVGSVRILIMDKAHASSMESFQGVTPKSPSSWHRSLDPNTNILRPHRSHPKMDNGLRHRRPTKENDCRKAWGTIEELARYEDEGWNDSILTEEGSIDHKNPNIEQLLRVMESRVDTLMKDAISIMGRSENVFGISSDMMRQLPPELSRQEAFEDLVMNFILDQEEKDKQLEEYMSVIGSDFVQLSLEVVKKLKEEIIIKKNKFTKIKKITRYPNTEDLKPLNGDKFSEALSEKASFHTPKFDSPKSLCVKHVRTIFLIHLLQGKVPLDLSLEYTSSVTYPEEVEETIRISMEVEPLDHTKLEDLGLHTCSHDLFLSSREIPSVDELEPQLLPKFSPLDVNLGDKRGTTTH